MTHKSPNNLRADRLMAHMRVLCKDIGPRPPTSRQERQAAEYVVKTLHALGYWTVRTLPFKSQNSYGWILVPTSLAATLSMVCAHKLGLWGKLLGGLLNLGAAVTLRDFTRARFPFFQELIARGTSQTVRVDIPPASNNGDDNVPTPATHHVYLVAHTDTQKQRFMAPPPRPDWMKPILTSATVAAAVGGISLLADYARQHKQARRGHYVIGAGLFMGFLSALFDEFQPHIEGASDNASGVSVLLGLAEALRTTPLARTHVTLLFTGCEEPVCVGIERYLREFNPPREGTTWIVVDMVGAGGVCYATKQGISYLTEYTPDPDLIQLAAQTSEKHPELGVVGKEMLTLDEVSNLRDHGYKALLLTSYGPDGTLLNWHRVTDTLENIAPDTLEQAARYIWALLQEVDG